MNLFKTQRKRKLLIATLAMLNISLIVFLNFSLKIPIIPINSVQSPIFVSAATTHQPVKITFGFPVRLKIPTINVDAALEHIGLTPNGDLDVPKGPTNVGWYDHGPRPGEKGTAVIDGHYGPWKNGDGSVFDHLDSLQIGEKLYVEDERGVTLTFVVRELRTYGIDDSHPDVFSSNDGQAHLNIITCNGIWNGAKKTYSNRLVVFADKETSP